MADKFIRISADTSPLREIRNAVEDITDSVSNLGRRLTDTPIIDEEDNRQIERQTALIRERNEVLNEISSGQQVTQTIVREEQIMSVSDDLLRRTQERYDENEQDISDLVKTRKTINRETSQGETQYQELGSEINRLREENSELQQVFRRRQQEERRATELQEANTIANPTEQQSGSRSERQLSVLRQIQVSSAALLELAQERNRLLGGEGIISGQSASNRSVPPLTVDGRQPPTIEQQQRRQNEQSGGLQRIGTGTTSVLIQGAVDAAGRVVNARNAYEGGAGAIGAGGAAVGGTIATIGNAFGPIGGAIGGIIGGFVSGVSQVVSAYATRVVAKTEELEGNVLRYVQTAGGSIADARSQAFTEGGYAASALGLNAGEYLQRRADILRSSGGRTTGGMIGDENGVNEANSLMAVERLYGIQPDAINNLQRSLRFASRGENEFGSQVDSGSAIIRSFENTLRDLRYPFSEIASTIEESLTTFNKTADAILTKAGEFDAGKVASVLNSVRLYTGYEGRQLERVQEAFTGQTISNDQVTQALLLRVARQTNPDADTFSALQEIVENPAANPELVRDFVGNLQGLAGTDEQLIQLLKASFPNLSYRDIRGIVNREGGFNPNELFQYLTTGQTEFQDIEASQYEASAAQQTVGLVEAATATKDNRDAARGGDFLPILLSIDKRLEQAVDELVKIAANPFFNTDEFVKAIKEGDPDPTRKALGLEGDSPVMGKQLNPGVAAVYNIIDKLFNSSKTSVGE